MIQGDHSLAPSLFPSNAPPAPKWLMVFEHIKYARLHGKLHGFMWIILFNPPDNPTKWTRLFLEFYR